jgi:hypothetical protein
VIRDSIRPSANRSSSWCWKFEEVVAGELLGAAGSEVDDLTVTVHEKIIGADGAYDFDVTVRYRFAGMAFLVVVEAKMHRNPIKRELVQVLHQKIRSVGAHKGVMVATSPYAGGRRKRSNPGSSRMSATSRSNAAAVVRRAATPPPAAEPGTSSSAQSAVNWSANSG